MSLKVNDGKELKGLKLKTITIIMIVSFLALCSIFIVSVTFIDSGYKKLALTYQESVKYRENAQHVREGSYYLTENVHLYVVTGDKQYADDYFEEVNVTKRRTNAVEDLRRTTVITSAQGYLIEALRLSERLKEREIYAICLVAQATAEDGGLDVAEYLATFDKEVAKCNLTKENAAMSPAQKRELALDIVFNGDYLTFRANIDSNIQQFLDATYNMTENTKDATIKSMKGSIIQQCIFIALVLALTISYSICISRLVLKPLKIYMKCVREGRVFELLGAYEFKHLALTYNNIFEVQHENEKMLRKNAEHDPLTGLLNRGAYNRISAQYVNRDISVAALIIDIDDFKTINDTYGHDVGDDIIKSVGTLLLSNFRTADIVARIGGDEFFIIMLDVTVESAENIRTKIQTLNNELMNPTSDLPKTSISVGIAFSEYGYSDELFKRADIALYQTKQGGKGDSSFNSDVILKPKSTNETKSSKKSKK